MEFNWVLYGLGAAICYAVMVLIFKKLLNFGVNPLVINFIIFGLVFVGFSIFVFVSKTPVKLNWLLLALFIVAAVFSLLGNFLEIKSVQEAPNPGYASALKAVQIVLITVAAVFLFGSEFSAIRWIGALLVFLGVFLLTK